MASADQIRTRPGSRAARVCGGAAVALGLTVLLGWATGAEVLKALDPARMPMAPSSAVLMVLFGGILVAAARARSARPVGLIALALLGLSAAALLLVGALLGIEADAEHLGFAVAGTIGGAPVGHMSPVTAMGFLLVGCAGVARLLDAPAVPRIALAVVVAAVGVTLTGAYLISRPLLYYSGTVPPALNTSLGLLLLGAGLTAASVDTRDLGPAGPPLSYRDVLRLTAAPAIVALFLVLAAVVLFRQYQESFRTGVEAELLAVADLKVEQVATWRGELAREAGILYENRAFADLVEAAIYEDDASARSRLQDWLEPLARISEFRRVAVMDSTGVARLTVGREDSAAPQHAVSDGRAVLRSGIVTVEGFHQDSPTGVPHLTVMVPLYDRSGAGLGAVAIRVDPATYLYPALMRWPAPSRTAESLLIRRDGDHVLFLNELRFRPGAAGSLRLSLEHTDRPSVRAVLGTTGIAYGVDYRGEPVVAAIRPVPGSGWGLVAKVAIREAFAPLRQQLLWTLGVVAALVTLAAAAIGFGWQRREKRHYQSMAESRQRSRALLDSIGDAVVATDGQGRIELLNPVAETLTGWSSEEAAGRPLETVVRLLHPVTREPVRRLTAPSVASGPDPEVAGAALLVHRDGRETPVEGVSAAVPARPSDDASSGVVVVFRDQSAALEARRRLREAAERAQRYLDVAAVMIVVLDPDGVVEVINSRGAEILGLDQDEIVGRNWFESFVPEEEREDVSAGFPSSVGGEKEISQPDTNHIITADGERRLIAWRNAVVRDEDGAVVRTVSSGQDITERLAAERALRESERRYRDLFEQAPVGIFRTRSDGQTLAVNGAMARILGFDTPEDAVAHYADLRNQLYVRPERRDEMVRRLREDGFVSGFQYEARRPDGSSLWLEMNARVAARHPDGTFDIEGFAADITDRKAAEETLRQQQAMLERTEAIAHIGSWEMDVRSGEISWSAEMYRILGLDPAKPPPSLEEHAPLFPEADFARLTQAVARATESGEPYDIELTVIRPDGEERTCRARGHSERGSDGAVSMLFGSLDDITERKRRAERERELETQLAQAQKMEAVGRLAGGVAHDFNNMLSVIVGHVEIAQDELGPDHPIYQSLDEVRQAAESSANLTRQLLAYAREQVADPEIIDLNEAVPDLIGMLRRVIGEEIELRWSPAPELAPVRIDPVQVSQVLTNLVVNARDAIDGVGQIGIETREAEVDETFAALHADAEPGPYVVLSVSDSGSGIGPEVRERLFDPFFTTKDVGEGTGLGLATVYGIVRQNDGFITVYSEPGQGSTFRVHLPRCDHAMEPGLSPEPVPARAPSRGDETILVVEDQPAVLRLVTKTLERLGYRVLAAGSPARALDLADREGDGIDLLITDVVMPQMNGRELADRIARRRADLPILFMSGYAEDVIASRGVLEDGVHFVEKPFTAAELAAGVRTALEAGGT